MSGNRVRTGVLATLGALALTGCGGGDEADEEGASASEPIPVATVEEMAVDYTSEEANLAEPCKGSVSWEDTSATSSGAQVKTFAAQCTEGSGVVTRYIDFLEYKDEAAATKEADLFETALVSANTTVAASSIHLSDPLAFLEELQEACDCGEIVEFGS